MPSMKTILRMSMITVGVIFAANQLAALSPQLRRLFKGSVVAPVTNAPTGYSDNWMTL